MESARFDESRWPILHVTTPNRVMDPDEYTLYVERISSYHERGVLFGLLFDVRRSPVMTADQRRIMAERIDFDLARYGRRCPCALVVNSAVQVGVVKVMMWLMKDPLPVGVFTSIAAAEGWLCGRLGLTGRLSISASSD